MIEFQVGQKVVCVDASRHNKFDIEELMEGVIYTVTWIGPFPFDEYQIVINVAEIVERPLLVHMLTGAPGFIAVTEVEKMFGPGGCGFRASRFRPLVEDEIKTRKRKRELV